ncbi:radical SAM family heme chaperone HemW [Oceanicoccus sp. KOV_DT_Chl]|uniref:radical SAM family heme chaperone HemW n=1 Tax=Oceanicoccus sp. KOV_DT_Chl TaxID=1904639 RepID=UPI000C7A76F5|nr:radical SAM family heme chaperone HemW [Oceanicoccus sp. KOV_DT_Chl]
MSNNFQIQSLPPLSLYIHIPWCVRKCPYCDFNSHTTDNIPEAEYVSALLADLDLELEFVDDRPLQSIFFGGGTPSLFSPAAIATILNGVAKRMTFADSIEITLEANPGTIEQQKFIGYQKAGINRLSIGVQSFNASHLKSLGRIHSNQEAIHAAKSAIKAGITNFNIDLMHGLPEQSASQALDDLQQAIELGVTHLSWYQLTIEPNTAFFSSPPLLPEDDQLADIQLAGEQLLNTAGLSQYEISAYSRDNKQAKHNINYWEFGDYIGIGAGAHGKLTTLTDQGIFRRWKTRAPKDYLNKENTYLAGNKNIDAEELPLEFLMNALRLNRGFHRTLFANRTGLNIAIIEPQLRSLFHKNLLQEINGTIATTDLGRRFLNSVLTEF